MTFENFLFDARSAVTLVSFLTFVGIVWWTYIAHRRDDFEAVARLPLDDDEIPTQSRENSNV